MEVIATRPMARSQLRKLHTTWRWTRSTSFLFQLLHGSRQTIPRDSHGADKRESLCMLTLCSPHDGSLYNSLQRLKLFMCTRCQVVGNRQMLSVGGNNPLDANSETTSKDPMAQGLQIFDLSDMTWSSSYDAHAAPYTTPQVVKDWYNKQ